MLKGAIDVILSKNDDAELPKFYGVDMVAATLTSGALFGEIGLGDNNSKRSATCVANQLTTLAVIDKEYWSLVDRENSNSSEVARDLRVLG